eukprot:3653647-Pyramimonas_sp.AAC.1
MGQALSETSVALEKSELSLRRCNEDRMGFRRGSGIRAVPDASAGGHVHCRGGKGDRAGFLRSR